VTSGRSSCSSGRSYNTASHTRRTEPMQPNYRMNLTRLRHRFSPRPDIRPRPGRLAEARLGLQLMRGR
jgi:hypothetical protein